MQDPGIADEPAAGPMRRIACERCGKAFTCRPVGPGRCWCGAETFQLPMPLPAEAGDFADCLCQDCLRDIAGQLQHLRS